MLASYVVDISRSWRLTEPGVFWDVLNELPVVDVLPASEDDAFNWLLVFLGDFRIGILQSNSTGLEIATPSGCQCRIRLNQHGAQVLKTRLDRLVMQRPDFYEKFGSCLDFLRRQVDCFQKNDDRELLILQFDENR